MHSPKSKRKLRTRHLLLEQLEDRRLLATDSQGALDTIPPKVVSVRVGSEGWATDFLSLIDPAGVGYPIPKGPDQLKPLPWAGVNQLVVEFSEDVGAVTESQVQLSGMLSGNQSPLNVSYDPKLRPSQLSRHDHTCDIAGTRPVEPAD